MSVTITEWHDVTNLLLFKNRLQHRFSRSWVTDFFNSRYSKFEFGACLLALGRLCLSLRLRSSQSYFHLPNSFFSIRAIWLASRLSRPKTFFPVRKKKYWILFFLEKTKNFKILKRLEKYVLACIWRSSGTTVAKVRMHFEFYCIFMHLNENNKLYAVNHIFMVRLKTLLYNVIQTVCKVSLLLSDIFSLSNSEWVLSWPHAWPRGPCLTPSDLGRKRCGLVLCWSITIFTFSLVSIVRFYSKLKLLNLAIGTKMLLGKQNNIVLHHQFR